MNAIVIILLSLLIATLWLQWWLGKNKKEDAAPPAPPAPVANDTLAQLVDMMKAEREQKAREAQEKEMREYALRKQRSQPPAPIQSSLTHEDGPIPNATDCIPYGLSADEKRTLRDFYNQV